ncbi:MAG: GGDEF domain-containing protein [Usitatibacter sp.]
MLPSAERLAGSGLAIAAFTIVALAALAMIELDREAALHRELIASLHVKDSLESLRIQITDLAGAARVSAFTQSSEAAQLIERRVVEIDAELDYLAQHPAREDRPAFGELARSARLLGVNARSVVAAFATRGAEAAVAASQETQEVSLQTANALERTLAAQRAGISERMLAQLRVAEKLRAYVSWLLAGSLFVLVGLFGFYRWAKTRERAAARRIEHLAHYDPMTGLPNRALLTDLLEREVARATRSERGFALVMFDLDGFKLVNDAWGHAAGDKLLAMVADRARDCMRGSDTVGRLGGDEFLAILPEASREGALQVAEKLRAAMSAPYSLGKHTAHLGASVGVSYFGKHGNDAEALQRSADMALYEAKRRGKNQVLEATSASA